MNSDMDAIFEFIVHKESSNNLLSGLLQLIRLCGLSTAEI